MVALYTLNPQFPQPHQIAKIVAQLRQGAVMLYPTDTVYAIGCAVSDKQAVERVRQLKQLSNHKPLTFLCPSLSKIALYAEVSDPAYRLMKRLIPGPFTFLLPATKLVPKLVLDPKRKITGIRVPDHAICQSLLQELADPIVSTSAKLGGEMVADLALTPAEFAQLQKQVDLVIEDDQPLGSEVSTVLDMTGNEPIVIRQGLGYDRLAPWLN